MRQWRQARRLTMEEAGAMFGVTKGAWHAWETGAKIPNHENMNMLYDRSDRFIRAAHFYGQEEQPELLLTG